MTVPPPVVTVPPPVVTVSPPVAVLPPPAVPTGPSATDGTMAQQVLREVLDSYARIARIVAGAGVTAPPLGTIPGREAAVGTRHLVYVHGICQHDAGFSDGWWRSMAPYVPSLAPGSRGPGGNRHEVVWSEFVRGGERSVAAADPQALELEERIVETLQERARRQASDASPGGARRRTRGCVACRETTRPSAPLFGIPGLDCIGDFTTYLFNPDARSHVINRFHEVVRPLLASGAAVDIIAHSWGTVVAYEGLVFLDGDSATPAGSVRNFFTVGSALAIGEVRRALAPRRGTGIVRAR